VCLTTSLRIQPRSDRAVRRHPAAPDKISSPVDRSATPGKDQSPVDRSITWTDQSPVDRSVTRGQISHPWTRSITRGPDQSPLAKINHPWTDQSPLAKINHPWTDQSPLEKINHPLVGLWPRPQWRGHGRFEDIISLGYFSLTDAAKGTSPIPNAAEARAATPSALSPKKRN
jgi:hypothetical protein